MLVSQFKLNFLVVVRGVARILKNVVGGGASNHEYITIIMLKVLQWRNEF